MIVSRRQVTPGGGALAAVAGLAGRTSACGFHGVLGEMATPLPDLAVLVRARGMSITALIAAIDQARGEGAANRTRSRDTSEKEVDRAVA